jgi:sarcosine oxidase subunit gamma
MTALTPLEFIHKKGLFGDHHKQYEKDMLKISELNNLTIIQVVKYKKSKAQINSSKIDGLELPLENSKVNCNQKTRILCVAPNSWFIISSEEYIFNMIKENFSDENFAVTDISHSRAVIQIKGLETKELLKKGCPINLNTFEKNMCAGSVFNGITILIDLTDASPDTFNILILRSFGESFYHHITDAALEFGYVGI